MSLTTLLDEVARIDFLEVIKSFPALFVTIDILGAIPVVMQIKQRGQHYSSGQVAVYSLIVLIALLLAGEAILQTLGINRDSFGVAGGIVLFVMAAEMVFGLEIFRSEEGASANASIVPLVFPLFAGAAVFTAILDLQGQGYANINIALSILLNMICVYLGLRFVDKIKAFIGDSGAHILRKFFGVILLAIASQIIIRGAVGIIG